MEEKKEKKINCNCKKVKASFEITDDMHFLGCPHFLDNVEFPRTASRIYNE